MTQLEAVERGVAPAEGVRVVIDARPMQEPERSPLTAEYLRRLLEAFARNPLEGESFVVVTRALRPDPSDDLERLGLPVAGRRRIPPTTHALRSAGMTLDSFLLRGAAFRTNTGHSQAGAVFHTAGGAVPVASRLPVVATLLDLAPWELPARYAASATARFGHRLRARVLHDAARVIVCSRTTADAAAQRLHLPADRIAVIPLAVGTEFRSAGRDVALVASTRERLDLPPRYLAFCGRYDARKDMRTLLQAVRLLRERQEVGDGVEGPRRPLRSATSGNGRHGPLPAVVLALDARLEEDARLLREQIESNGVADMVSVVSMDSAAERAAVIAGAEAFVYPALSEATGLPVLEALSLGVPVICSRAGALPETVGSAGIVVAPRDPRRLAAAIEAVWDAGSLGEQLRRQAHRRAESWTRTWADVAHETRLVYAEAAQIGRR